MPCTSQVHCGMVDDTKRIRKYSNVYRVFHCGMVDDTKQIRKCNNLCCALYLDMVDDTKQIRKCSNLHRVFCCGMVNDGEFSGFLCSCLCIVDDIKLAWVTR